jgi:hypothetical protein
LKVPHKNQLLLGVKQFNSIEDIYFSSKLKRGFFSKNKKNFKNFSNYFNLKNSWNLNIRNNVICVYPNTVDNCLSGSLRLVAKDGEDTGLLQTTNCV